MRPGRIRTVMAAATLAALAACDRYGVSPLGPVSTSAQRSRVAVAPRSVREDERTFAEIAQEVPSYGGHFLDKSGTLTAYIVDDADINPARGALQRRVQAGASGRLRPPPGVAYSRIAILKGAYTYQQLSDWRDLVFEQLLGKVAGVVTDDLDEARNRVTIGIVPGQETTVQPLVLQRLAALGVPAEAIRFLSERGPSPQSAVRKTTFPPSDLRVFSDDLVGGLQISFFKDATQYDCTLGYTAQLADGSHALITASHCSSVKFSGPDGTAYFQPYQGGSPSIGTELYDPAGGTCPALWPCSTYRFSDASIVQVNSSRGWRRGLIARPVSRVSGSAGPTNVSSVNPYLYVTAVAGTDVLSGFEVDKIGRTTGWTYGPVDRTCVDYMPGGFDWDFDGQMTRCAYTATMTLDGGDSGSPVFTYDGRDGAWAVGILFGASGNAAYFSKWMYVNSELSAGGLYQPNITTGATMSFTSASTTQSGNTIYLSWAPATTTNTSGTTTYYVHRNVWDASTYTWVNQDVMIGSTASLSFTDSSLPVSVNTFTDQSQPAECVYTFVEYIVEAYNSGVRGYSQPIYYQGAANGPTPFQDQCP
jgi:hypothetical protein